MPEPASPWLNPSESTAVKKAPAARAANDCIHCARIFDFPGSPGIPCGTGRIALFNRRPKVQDQS